MGVLVLNGGQPRESNHRAWVRVCGNGLGIEVIARCNPYQLAELCSVLVALVVVCACLAMARIANASIVVSFDSPPILGVVPKVQTTSVIMGEIEVFRARRSAF